MLIYLLFAYTYHQKSGNEEFSSKSKSYVDLYWCEKWEKLMDK